MFLDPTFISQFIQDGESAPYGLAKFYDSILMTDKKNPDHIFRIPLSDTFLKYRSHLVEAQSIYALPSMFYYKPKTISFELYGTVDMWLALLRLNGMRNISEFNKSGIRIYEPASVMTLIDIFFKREGKIT